MLAKIKFIDEGKTLRVVSTETFTCRRRIEIPKTDKNGFRIGSLEIDSEYFTVLDLTDVGNSLWIGDVLPTYSHFQKKDFEYWLKKICPVKVRRSINKRSGIITYYFG